MPTKYKPTSPPITDAVGSHPPAPGLTASLNRATGRLPVRKAAAPGAGTLLRVLFYLPLFIVLAVFAGILFLGYSGGVDE